MNSFSAGVRYGEGGASKLKSEHVTRESRLGERMIDSLRVCWPSEAGAAARLFGKAGATGHEGSGQLESVLVRSASADGESGRLDEDGAGAAGAAGSACMAVLIPTFKDFFELQHMAREGVLPGQLLGPRRVIAASATPARFRRQYGHPASPWSYRICKLADYKSLMATSAYLSTLGGGWFMTRKVSNAQAMARRQLHVARLLGDNRLILACQIHLVYSQIQLGQFAQASDALAEQMHVARNVLSDEKLVSIVQSAIHHNNCAAALAREQNLAPVLVGGTGSSSKSSTAANVKDEYYRYRIVVESRGKAV